jgi:basic membrane protein A and related proteins
VKDSSRAHALRLLMAMLALVAALAVAACGDDDDGGGDSGGSGGGDATEASSEEPKKIALLTTGTQNDKNWGEAFTIGAEAAAEATGAELTIVDNLNEPPQYAQQGASFGQEGYDMVLMALGTVQDVQLKLAQQFPDTLWCGYGIAPENPPENTCFVDALQEQQAFLGGVAAGLATETGVVGAVNGFEFPQLTRQPEAYALGARCVNPDVKFVQKYINSWTDAALGKAAAQGLIGQDADVLLAPLTTATQGLVAAARENDGVWVMPEYFDSNDTAKDVILTSVLFDLETLSEDVFTRGLNGELQPGEMLPYPMGDLPNSGVAPFYEDEAVVGEDGLAQIEEIKQKIVDGEIKVPTTDEIGTVGSGMKIDPASIGCTA